MDAIESIFQLDLKYIIIGIFVILAGFECGHKLLIYFLNITGIEFKWLKNKRDDHRLLTETVSKLDDLSKQRDIDVAQSIQHDKKIKSDLQDFMEEMTGQVKSIKQDIVDMKNDMDSKFKENEERENERVQAELKDRIGQSYRYYHSIGKINDMELEALKDLIKSYERHGGKNSFVHSTVQPEMYTWENVN